MANKKITDLVDIGTPASGDLLEIVDISEGVSKRVAVSALGSTPTLQEVTDEGNTTTNAIEVSSITVGNLLADGFSLGISDADDGIYNFQYIPYMALYLGDGGAGSGVGLQLHQDASIIFQTALGAGILRADFLTDTRNLQLPDADGTLALTTDIPPAITIDATPTDGSANAVSSNGVFDALALKQTASTRKNANNSSNDNINYCGVALGTAISESTSVWTIQRLTIASAGTVTTASATSVAWTDRETATYV